MTKIMAGIKKLLIHNKILFPISLRIQSLIYNLFYKDSHQISHFTLYNRYPALFSFVKKYFSDRKPKELKVLCYGCSTGEECFSLNTYLKQADILGLDIQKKVLLKARSQNESPNIRFLLSTPENLSKNGPYDLILAMAVFCRWPASNYCKNISKLYPFKRFEENMRELDRTLKTGGLLLINNANFYFQDTDISAKYELLNTPDGVEKDVVPKFSKENEWLGITDNNGVIFKKIK